MKIFVMKYSLELYTYYICNSIKMTTAVYYTIITNVDIKTHIYQKSEYNISYIFKILQLKTNLRIDQYRTNHIINNKHRYFVINNLLNMTYTSIFFRPCIMYIVQTINCYFTLKIFIHLYTLFIV